MHATVAGCAAFVLGITYFFVTGGSARYDAYQQNLCALALLLGFGGAGSYIFWSCYLRRISWLGDQIRLTRAFGQDAFYQFTDLVDVGESWDGSECKLHFSDGRRLRVSVYSHGFHQFVGRMVRRLKAREAASRV